MSNFELPRRWHVHRGSWYRERKIFEELAARDAAVTCRTSNENWKTCSLCYRYFLQVSTSRRKPKTTLYNEKIFRLAKLPHYEHPYTHIHSWVLYDLPKRKSTSAFSYLFAKKETSIRTTRLLTPPQKWSQRPRNLILKTERIKKTRNIKRNRAQKQRRSVITSRKEMSFKKIFI